MALWLNTATASSAAHSSLLQSSRITLPLSLAFIGSASVREVDTQLDADAEALSITRLEGSRWRGGRLWSWKWDLRERAVVDRGTVGARAAAARTRRMARTDTTPDVTGWHTRWRHTTPDTWATTSTRTPVVTRQPGTHEVSKLSVTEARWSAERIGPTIMAAPHRGQAHVAAVSVVGAGAAASVGGCAIGGAASKVRASATRVAR